MLLEGLNEIQM